MVVIGDHNAMVILQSESYHNHLETTNHLLKGRLGACAFDVINALKRNS